MDAATEQWIADWTAEYDRRMAAMRPTAPPGYISLSEYQYDLWRKGIKPNSIPVTSIAYVDYMPDNTRWRAPRAKDGVHFWINNQTQYVRGEIVVIEDDSVYVDFTKPIDEEDQLEFNTNCFTQWKHEGYQRIWELFEEDC